jgi:hypothetical protein
MWKFKLAIVKSISWSILSNTCVKLDWWGWKSMVPKGIWISSTCELLLAKSEKTVEFMMPTPRVPTVGANWWGLNSTNVLDEGLRIRETGRRINSKANSVKQGGYESKCGCRTWLAFNLSHTVLSWPLYIGGQVSSNQMWNIIKLVSMVLKMD